MISKISQISLFFKGNETITPHQMYNMLIERNKKIAQNQTISTYNNQNQIPMQGNEQNLDVIA